MTEKEDYLCSTCHEGEVEKLSKYSLCKECENSFWGFSNLKYRKEWLTKNGAS